MLSWSTADRNQFILQLDVCLDLTLSRQRLHERRLRRSLAYKGYVYKIYTVGQLRTRQTACSGARLSQPSTNQLTIINLSCNRALVLQITWFMQTKLPFESCQSFNSQHHSYQEDGIKQENAHISVRLHNEKNNEGTNRWRSEILGTSWIHHI